MKVSPDQFLEIYRKLPQAVKDFLSDPKFGDLIETLGKKYNLHVDTTGILAEATTEMLAGITNPNQFVSDLKTAGVPDQSATALLQDINEKVFKPIQKEIRQEKPPETQVTTPKQPPLVSVPKVEAALPPMPQVTSKPQAPQVSPQARTMARDVEHMKDTPVPPPTPQKPIVPLPPPLRTPPAATPSAEEVTSGLKQYGIDPYREPIG